MRAQRACQSNGNRIADLLHNGFAVSGEFVIFRETHGSRELVWLQHPKPNVYEVALPGLILNENAGLTAGSSLNQTKAIARGYSIEWLINGGVEGSPVVLSQEFLVNRLGSSYGQTQRVNGSNRGHR